MSAVSQYAKTTFQRYSKGQTSISYLHNPIHSPDVTEEIKKWTKDATKDEKDAKQLQEILQEIKKYGQERKKDNHQAIAAYDELLNIFDSIKSARGESAVQIFRREQQIQGGSQHAFEEDMADINKALIELFNKQGILKDNSINLAFEIGTERTNILLTEKQLIEPMVQAILQALQINSVKVFKDRVNKIKISDKKGGFLPEDVFRVLQQVEGKIDVAGHSVEITQTLNIQGGSKLIKLNQLFNKATFTLKNYKSGRSVEIGSTNIFRVLYTIVNYFRGSELTSDGVLSFTYALATRHNKNQASADIEKHLGHLQVIYELTGLGQQYINQDIEELKTYSQEGAKFLIVNTHNNDKIQVLSTKSLLIDLFNNSKYAHFQDTVRIGRKILNKKSKYD